MAHKTYSQVSGMLPLIWQGALEYAQEHFFLEPVEKPPVAPHGEMVLPPVKAHIPFKRASGNSFDLPPLWTLFNSEISHSNIRMHARRLNRE